MKNYTITVNGTPYNVSVEEGTSSAPAAAPAGPAVRKPETAPPTALFITPPAAPTAALAFAASISLFAVALVIPASQA